MSMENSNSGASNALSSVAQLDDINRLNGVLNDGAEVLNDGAAAERSLDLVKQMEWFRNQWAAAEAESARLQTELNEALRSLAKWESKFVLVRKLLDSEKRERNIALKKYRELTKLLDTIRNLLFHDNQANLNDETRQKLAFLNSTAQDHKMEHQEFNDTATLLCELSYSISDDELDVSLSAMRRSWMRRGGWHARKSTPGTPTNKKQPRSSSLTATKTAELQDGKVLAAATTMPTLEVPTTSQYLTPPPQNFQPISASSVAPLARKSSGRISNEEMPTPIALVCTDTETASDISPLPMNPTCSAPQRPLSVISAAYGVSPRARLRQHNFCAKTLFKRKTCGPCGKTITFAKMGVKCKCCRAQSHMQCREWLPLPCVPPGASARKGRRTPQKESRIADYAPGTPPMVPALLVHCINEVEKRGLVEPGIYSVSGAETDVTKLKECFLRGGGTPQLANEDIHVVCGCIRDFLRSLRERLVSTATWADFMHAGTLTEPTDATAAIVQAISELPPPNRDTLAFLILHLQKVAESAECEMSVESLAEMFAPTVVGYGLLTQAAEMEQATPSIINAMLLMLRLPADYWTQWYDATRSDRQ